jgi:hypothetical protein
MHLSSDTLILLFGLNVVLGALAGWFCRRAAVLILLALVFSYAVPYGMYYMPPLIHSLHSSDSSGIDEYRAWAPLFIREMFFYGAPAIWVAAGVAHFTRSRYDSHHKPVA